MKWTQNVTRTKQRMDRYYQTEFGTQIAATRKNEANATRSLKRVPKIIRWCFSNWTKSEVVLKKARVNSIESKNSKKFEELQHEFRVFLFDLNSLTSFYRHEFDDFCHSLRRLMPVPSSPFAMLWRDGQTLAKSSRTAQWQSKSKTCY